MLNKTYYLSCFVSKDSENSSLRFLHRGSLGTFHTQHNLPILQSSDRILSPSRNSPSLSTESHSCSAEMPFPMVGFARNGECFGEAASEEARKWYERRALWLSERQTEGFSAFAAESPALLSWGRPAFRGTTVCGSLLQLRLAWFEAGFRFWEEMVVSLCREYFWLWLFSRRRRRFWRWLRCLLRWLCDWGVCSLCLRKTFGFSFE